MQPNLSLPPGTNNFKVSQDLWLCDFQSPDTGSVILNSHLVDRFQFLISILGFKPIITSGFRTPEHNAAVGGVKDSLHLSGQAVDIGIELPALKTMVYAAKNSGFLGIIFNIKKNPYLHLDLRTVPYYWDQTKNAPLEA